MSNQKPHYIIATLIGMLIGITIALIVGTYTEWTESGWQIPHILDGTLSAHARELRDQAALLRSAHLFLDNGLTFLTIPILICLALAKLMPRQIADKGNLKPFFWLRVAWCYMCCASVVMLIASTGFMHVQNGQLWLGCWGHILLFPS